MDNLSGVHIIKSHANLNEPLEDLILSEGFTLLLLLFDVIRQIAH